MKLLKHLIGPAIALIGYSNISYSIDDKLSYELNKPAIVDTSENTCENKKTNSQQQTTLESYTITDHDATNTQINFHNSNFHGGIGKQFNEDGSEIQYINGLTQFSLGKSDLTLAFHALDDQSSSNNDVGFVQVAFDPNSNWSIGGGYFDFSGDDNDFGFGRILYRQQKDNLDYLVGGFVSRTSDKTHLGLSGLVSLEDIAKFNAALGVQMNDEQARYTIGLVSPKLDKAGLIQPAIDILYVDNNVGEPGPQFSLGNFTLGYRGRYFKSDNRIGRLLGGTGIWYKNFIFGTDSSLRHNLNYNRLGDPWIVGDLMNIQAIQLKMPDGTKNVHIDSLVLPFQFNIKHNILDNIFVGWSYDSFGDEIRRGPLIGTTFNCKDISCSFSLNLYDNDKAGSLILSLPLVKR